MGVESVGAGPCVRRDTVRSAHAIPPCLLSEGNAEGRAAFSSRESGPETRGFAGFDAQRVLWRCAPLALSLSKKTVPGKISQAKAPDQTFEEVKYLRRLIDGHIPVHVR